MTQLSENKKMSIAIIMRSLREIERAAKEIRLSLAKKN